MATPPDKKPPILEPVVVARRLERQPWDCAKVKDYAKASLWRTQFGFYFTVPHECTAADLEAIMDDLRKFGRKRNV